MYISDKIMIKVAAREEENENLNRCLSVRICPKCGGDLKIPEVNEDDGIDYICSNCTFKHST